MTTQGPPTSAGRGRSLLGAFRSVPATNQRVAQLEAELQTVQLSPRAIERLQNTMSGAAVAYESGFHRH